ncbi:hypothetical protein ATANTOWER_016510 [Ataeniobius toweri]|uniref:Uncharacterized protein n=1 Tax=Ataeniobius toweri TaxID=208326 RepID=A0ABU7CH09_9TELE|nr:hypothetical protein [Ataeniobius toweri]
MDLLFVSAFPFKGSPQRVICPHLILSSASSSLTPTTFRSSSTPSMNLLFGLPLGLLPSSLSFLLQMYSLSLLCTFPNHFSLRSLSLFQHINMSCPSDQNNVLLNI